MRLREIRPRTRELYTSLLANHLKPTFGDSPLVKIVLALKARGVAVLLNSHLIGEVERVCDRVVILDRGRVAASGTLASCSVSASSGCS